MKVEDGNVGPIGVVEHAAHVRREVDELHAGTDNGAADIDGRVEEELLRERGDAVGQDGSGRVGAAQVVSDREGHRREDDGLVNGWRSGGRGDCRVGVFARLDDRRLGSGGHAGGERWLRSGVNAGSDRRFLANDSSWVVVRAWGRGCESGGGEEGDCAGDDGLHFEFGGWWLGSWDINYQMFSNKEADN